MSSRAFTSQLAVLGLGVAAGAGAEAAACALRLWAVSPSLAMSSAVSCFGLWAAPLALGAIAAAWLLAWLCDEESWRDALARRWTERPEASAATLLAGSMLFGSVFLLARACSRFRNVELAAALLTVLVLLAAAACLALAILIAAWGKRRRTTERAAPLGGIAVALAVLVVAFVGFESRSGLRQLDARLLALPLATGSAVFLLDRVDFVRAHGRRVVALMAGIWLLSLTTFLVFAGAASSVRLAGAGAWTPYLISGLQKLSDVDRDGYSSLLGGGDCASFDAAINPGAAEIRGDGIDNNCIGGDSGKEAQPSRPSWGSQFHGSITNLNVVIVTIETFRHDHASFLGARHDTTPELRKLASESLVFERMYSAAPHTRLALASLFSSYAPSEIDWVSQPPDKRMRRIGPQTPWLPELLRARGYETIAVLTDFSAFTEQENAGFERGFVHYDVSTKLHYRGGTMWGFPAAEQVDKAAGYAARAAKPYLLWLHLFEPHYNYEQPPDAPRFGGDEQSRYDAEIWHVDKQIGRLIEAFKAQGTWDKTVLLVSGDHGEAFGEHDDRFHGSNLHDPQLRPAALLRVPGMAGKRITEVVTFTDLAPTITRLLGDRQSFDQLRGRSLTPLLHRSKLPDAAGGIVAESFSVDDGRAYQAALVDYPLKLIYVEAGRSFSLFDLSRDPAELRPLDAAKEPRAAPLLQRLVGYLERARPRSLGP